eukprot:TRINITY_DN10217_c0_g1_i1.p1 TRINITY_DN10217_c0_g1~~TRINITY_DN10217_c0_g1_i1.p1  ORF type:complete len:992 (-),score=177.03 TRINITY_DN10217_c0_g1_i1:33-2840(-)
MKGLLHFISDIRDCQSNESEQKRVTKELANIRHNFLEDQSIKGYNVKKYVAKLVYIYMLGYDVDFGHKQALNLIHSHTYSDKQIGYLAVGLFLHEDHELLPLLIQAVSNDLVSLSEHAQGLALAVVANLGGKQMAEVLSTPISKLLLASSSSTAVKMKAALALMRLRDSYPTFLSADPWAERLGSMLVVSSGLGVCSAVASLLISTLRDESAGYESCAKPALDLLIDITVKKDYPREHEFYAICNPWLQVKILRILCLLPPPDSKTLKSGVEVLNRIIKTSSKLMLRAGAPPNQKNAQNAILFEAIDLIIHWDCDVSLITKVTNLIGSFITAKETNTKYLGLEAMAHLTKLHRNKVMHTMNAHQETVIVLLKDVDISIRRHALNLLYGMCNKNNSRIIVGELLNYLLFADYDIREELVLKIAVLAERFASDNAWYIDTILRLITLGGESVPDNIWYRIVQIVTNHDDIQAYATAAALSALRKSAHEITVNVAAYLLGEFGHLITNQPGCSAQDQFMALNEKFYSTSDTTKALILSTYAKFMNIFPELIPKVETVFKQHESFVDAEIQQRAHEYHELQKLENEELLSDVLETMPPFDFDETKFSSGDEDEEDEESQGDDDGSSGSSAEEPEQKTIVDVAPFDIMNPTGGATEGGSTPIAQPATVPESQEKPSTPAGMGTLPTRSGVVEIQHDRPPASREENLARLFKFLCVNKEGVLYEDENLQIGLKSEYAEGKGKIMLFYGNRAAGPITSFTTLISPVIYLNIQMQQIEAVIPAGRQVQQLINVSCVTPFQNALSAQISYIVSGRSFNLLLRLPVVLTKFMHPAATSQGFLDQWKSLAGQPFEHQSVFKAGQPLTLEYVKKLFSIGFNLSVFDGLDPSPHNIVAGGSLFVKDQAIPVLLRLEANTEVNMWRLTVRTPEQNTSVAIKNIIASQFI